MTERKIDRESRVHKRELIDRMVIKENLDRPGLNLTKEDMEEALINDRVEKLAKEKAEDELLKKLRIDQA